MLSWCNGTTDPSVCLSFLIKVFVLVPGWLLSEALTELHTSEPLVERATAIFLICFMILGPLKPIWVILSNLTNTLELASFLFFIPRKKKNSFLLRCVVSFTTLSLTPSPLRRGEGARVLLFSLHLFYRHFKSLDGAPWSLWKSLVSYYHQGHQFISLSISSSLPPCFCLSYVPALFLFIFFFCFFLHISLDVFAKKSSKK